MTTKKYLDFVISKLEEVKKTQITKIEKASDLIVESCIRDGRFYIFGSGHSHMIAEELYIRAGGLAYVKAILPPELMLHEMPNKSTHLERMDGYAKSMLELHKVDSNDTLMVISNSGRNSVPVEMCLHAKEIGANVIALTSLKHTMEVSSRHKSGKNIYQIADVVIDNCADRGDAAFYVKDFDVPTGPTSSVTGTAIAQAIIVNVIERLVKQGIRPPVFKSSNMDGADEYNEGIFEKYYGYWK